MDSKTKIFWMLIILALILSAFCLAAQWRINNFQRDCKITYNLNDSCPCKQTKFSEDRPLIENGGIGGGGGGGRGDIQNFSFTIQ